MRKLGVAEVAVLLLAALVLTVCASSLIVVTRCLFWPAEICQREWGVREWISEIIIALIALASRREP